MTNVSTMPSLASGQKVSAIVPTNYNEMAAMAQTIFSSGLAPRGYDTPQKVAVAIMMGAELGFPPMMAISKIAIVNGRPAPYGDAIVAVVRRSGLCEFIDERIEGEGDNRVAICETKRKTDSRPVIRKFSVADAKKAKLWGKAGPWQDYPERMMAMRARGFALRDAYGDLLSATYDAEEAADIPAEPEIKAIAAPMAVAEPTVATSETILEATVDDQEFVNMMISTFKMAETEEALMKWAADNAAALAKLSEKDVVHVRKEFADYRKSLLEAA